MAYAAQVNFREGPDWRELLRAELASVATDVAPVDWHMRQIELCFHQVWHCFIEGERVGCVVWRIDFQPACREFTIVAAVGWSDKFDLTETVLPRINDFARSLGCATVRCHITRMGLVVKLRRFGFDNAEWVLRKRLA